MPRTKKTNGPPKANLPDYNPQPVPINAAPGYGAPASAPAPAYAPPAYPPPAPGGATAAYTAGYGAPANGQAPNGQPAAFGPPPPRAPQEPFINALMLYEYKRPITAKIEGMRDATGTGNVQYQRPGQPPKRGWFLDFTLEDGKKATGRINEGDLRHHKLWTAYQDKIVGRTVVLRLSNPGDIDPFTRKQTKAPWTLDTM